jgi:hypothetical protein
MSDEAARAYIMRALTELGMDSEDAAVLSGAKHVWVDTPIGAVLRPIAAEADALVSLRSELDATKKRLSEVVRELDTMKGYLVDARDESRTWRAKALR